MSRGLTIRRSAAVSRILFPSIRPCGLTQGDNHSSRPAIAGRLKQPTRKLRTGSSFTSALARQSVLPYLVLLRAGFCLPRTFLRARCALTAPFHPYLAVVRLRSLARATARLRLGGIFSVPLSFELPRPGVTRRTALWSSDFPLFDSPLRGSLRAGPSTGSRAACCERSPEGASRTAVVCHAASECQRTPVRSRARRIIRPA